jgi:hypothetical protein
MKRILFGILVCLAAMNGRAQVVETMEEQIIALTAFIKTAEKGYALVEQGLHTIGDIKSGEYALHRAYFGALSSVNPAVRNMTEVGEIIRLEGVVVDDFSKALTGYRQTAWLHPDEVSFMGQVYGDLVNWGVEDGTSLSDLSSDGRLEMDDGQRIQRIEVLDAGIRERYGYVQGFIREADLLIVQRRKAAGDLGAVGSWYGLK